MCPFISDTSHSACILSSIVTLSVLCPLPHEECKLLPLGLVFFCLVAYAASGLLFLQLPLEWEGFPDTYMLVNVP